MNSFIRLLILSIVIVGASCTTTTIDKSLDYGYEYFPLELGKWWEYEGDSIIYVETLPTDTIVFQVREEVADTFLDSESRLTYRIERSVREHDTLPWEIRSVWSANLFQLQAEKIEENLRFIKLVFPISEGADWDGSLYLGGLSSIPVTYSCNNLSFLEGWGYEYVSVGAELMVNGMNFDSVITVEQKGDENLLEFNQAVETYAADIGLIKKEFKHYTTTIICDTCVWEEKVECVYSYRLNLTGHN